MFIVILIKFKVPSEEIVSGDGDISSDATLEKSSEPPEKKKKNDDRTECWSLLIDAISKDDGKDDLFRRAFAK